MPIDAEPPETSAPPVTEAVVASIVAAPTAEHSSHHKPVHTHCENCGAMLRGPFCHDCGQHDIDFHRSFGHVFLDALENFFHFDAKLFRNLVTLLFQPGRLTAEFNAGKRAAQMPPLRLYIFVSLIFFFLIFVENQSPARVKFSGPAQPVVGFTVDGQPASVGDVLDEVGRELANKPKGKRAVDQLREAAEKARAAAEASAAEQAKKSGTRQEPQSGIGAWLNNQGRRAADPEHQRELVQSFLHSLPKMLLVCLPFFALYTRFLFRKSGQVYLQHLIVALHFHTFIFLWVMFRDGWVFLAGLPDLGLARWIKFACNLWLVLYPFFLLRRLFANSWRKTIFKTGLLALGYVFTLAVAMFITGFVILALL